MSGCPLCPPGRFQCSQCLHKWSSAKVHILFHMRRGKVRMRIFRQSCRRCPSAPLEEPSFSQENMERILHNLVLQILKDFYNVPVQPSELLEVVVDTVPTGPHDSSHCEGCRLGVCTKPLVAPKTPTWKPRRHLGTTMSLPVQLYSNFPEQFSFHPLSVCILAVIFFIVLFFTLK